MPAPSSLPGKWFSRITSSAATLFLLGLAGVLPAHASPLEYLPVGDPLEAELRVLDVLGPGPGGAPLRLPRLGTRPLQRFELDSLPLPADAPGPAHAISLTRLHRVLGRETLDATSDERERGLTPRLFQRRYPDGTRFEVSVGAEAGGTLAGDRVRYAGGSGLHTRVGVQLDRWVAFSHLVAGHQDTARTYADPIIPLSNIIIYSSDSYLGYTGASGRWGIEFGRSRWHWGPGEEGSLLLSKTAVPITGLAFHSRIEALRADATALSATLRSVAGEQLAAHRLEWQPADRLRLGVSEAARYRSAAWQPLYLVGVIPYILVQRFQAQDEPGQAAAIRNNIMVDCDVSWRVAPGTRVYGELLADDLHVIKRIHMPNKYGYQFGWDGVGMVRGRRLVWGGEYTRVTRFVYTSFFGHDFVAQNQPLGFPVAPDAARLRVRAACDLTPAWQLTSTAARTEKGQNTLDQPFVPGSPNVDAAKFQGVVEEARTLDAGLRWWPAGGIDLAVTGGHRWVDGARHIAGARSADSYGSLTLRLTR